MVKMVQIERSGPFLFCCGLVGVVTEWLQNSSIPLFCFGLHLRKGLSRSFLWEISSVIFPKLTAGTNLVCQSQVARLCWDSRGWKGNFSPKKDPKVSSGILTSGSTAQGIFFNLLPRFSETPLYSRIVSEGLFYRFKPSPHSPK